MGKGKPMKISRKGLLAAIAVSAVLLLSFRAASPQQSSPQLSSEQIAQIVASPDRSEADRTNDLRRKPEQMLAFIGIRPGIVALDLSAAGGYTTELLARAIGPSGTVYGQSQPRDPSRTPTPPAAPEGNSNPTAAPSAASATPATARRPSAEALAERDNKLRSNGVPAASIVAISRPFADPVPPELAAERIDLVTLMFNYHDLGHLGVDRAAMNRAVFRALKPGGLYVIADHSGRPGTGISESGTLHRIEEAFSSEYHSTLFIEPHILETPPIPTNEYEAKFSAQFVVATCLLKGVFGLADLMPAALKDPTVLDLAARVTCTIDPESAFPTFFSGGVRLHLRDGRTLFRHVCVNSGAGERALDTDGMSRKFLASATLVIPRDNAERIRDAVLTLEYHTAAHLASLLRSEAPSPGSEKHS
jgi:predicted methyltransferase